MPRAIAIFLFVALSAENYADMPFEGRWETPFRPLGELLYRASPIKAPTLALILMFLLVLARGRPGARSGRVAALDRAIQLNLGALGAMFAYGMLRGGSLLPALLQVQVMLFLPFSALLFTAGLRDESELSLAGKALLYAALYRGCLVLYFAFQVAPALGVKPATMTTHGDTVLFACTVVMLASWALEAPTRRNVVRAVALIAFLLVVIQVNNRRLAYVCVGAAFSLLFVLYDHPELKRMLKRRLLMLTPLIAIYVAAGWGSDSPIFKPVKAISSLAGKHQDTSSMTRDIENYNLLLTLKPNVLVGRGWGHEYDEVSVAYSISEAFPIYRYVPHNAVLGMWAFTGYLGSTAWWLLLVVATFLALRAYRAADSPLARTISATSACAVVVYMLQGYGDMGLNSWSGTLTLGLACAGASRMAALTGALPALGIAPSEDASEEEGQGEGEEHDASRLEQADEHA